MAHWRRADYPVETPFPAAFLNWPMGRVRSPFFFSSRRRHTRYIVDLSSDVCSSDLDRGGHAEPDDAHFSHGRRGELESEITVYRGGAAATGRGADEGMGARLCGLRLGSSGGRPSADTAAL